MHNDASQLKKRFAPGETAARERLATAQAERVELDVAARRGELVETFAVEKRWDDMTAAFRARLLSLPQALAPELAEMTHPASIEVVLENHVTEALEELSMKGDT